MPAARSWRESFPSSIAVQRGKRSNGRQSHLRPRVLDLADAHLSSFSVSEIAQSHLEGLRARLHERAR